MTTKKQRRAAPVKEPRGAVSAPANEVLEEEDVRRIIGELRAALEAAELRFSKAGWREVSRRVYDARLRIGRISEDL